MERFYNKQPPTALCPYPPAQLGTLATAPGAGKLGPVGWLVSGVSPGWIREADGERPDIFGRTTARRTEPATIIAMLHPKQIRLKEAAF